LASAHERLEGVQLNASLILSSKKIMILGLAKDVELHLVQEIEALLSAFSDFSQVGFLIVESDSSDATLEKLRFLKESIPNFNFITLGELSREIPNRVDRITYCRNVYLSEFESNLTFVSYDYVAVADLDGVNKDLTREAVRSCWIRSDWAGCAANQSAPYYDIYALRHKTWSPNDCWIYEAELRANGLNPVSSRERAVYSRQIIIPKNSEWIEVDSAFGGLCIYRKDLIAGCRYSSYTHSGTPVCEHVEFHAQIRSKGGRIFINPDLVNSGWNLHNSSKKPIKYIKRRLKLLIWLLSPRFRRRGF
jgi:hypothetical protein